MRKIIFRAWDKEMEMMIYSDGRNKNDWQVHYDFVFGDNGLHCCWEEEYDDKFGYPATNNGELDNIMQYIGLRDKNGADIYEGDIFKTRNGVVAVVEWDENNGRFLGFTLERERKIVYVGQEPAVEVICNIYDALGVYLVETDTTGTSMKNNRY